MKLDRRWLSPWLPAFGLAAFALAPPSPAQGLADTPPLQLVEATIDELHAVMQSGLLTAEGLAERYRLRVDAYEDVGPQLNALIALNPNLAAEARQRDLDARRTGLRGPLFGIPVLLKDNVDALPMATTAGSVALVGSLPPDDAFITAKLRQAGAVVFGKATMTEFANFMTTGGMPNGYSSLGGHGVNPYDTRRLAGGEAIVDPGGSSSGSGIATAANLVSALRTETIRNPA